MSETQILPRDLTAAHQVFKNLCQKTQTILIIANPHGLHAQTFLKLIECAPVAVILEKPACTSLEEIRTFPKSTVPVAICHGYRMSWGIQKLKALLQDPTAGKIFSIEGRYWQSSIAQKSLQNNPSQGTNWKDNEKLNGPYDVLLDLGTHLFDLSTFLIGSTDFEGSIQLHHVNSDSSFRDSHVNYDLRSIHPKSGATASLRGSISKTAHGFGNDLQLSVLTDRRSFEWNFSNPDQITIGYGDRKEILSRTQAMPGSGLAPFHGAGWLEGYIEIWRAVLIQLGRLSTESRSEGSFPKLEEHLQVLNSLFTKVEIK